MSPQETLWNYLCLGQELPKRADAIIVCGSHDLRVAKRGIELYKQGLAPLLIFSGGRGRDTTEWDETESERFAQLATKVPQSAILLESESTNTGENINNTRALTQEKVRSAIIVHKPFLERRTLATTKRYWPRLDATITSPKLTLTEYPTTEISERYVLSALVGEVQRLVIYPDKGFQVPQDIPQAVMEAYNSLVEQGYTDQLISN